jgi:hypothetical protein
MRPMSYLASYEFMPATGGYSAAERRTLREIGPLRWQHVAFYIHAESVAADITFHHIKGNQSPKLATTEQTRTYTLWPVRGDRLHLDVAAVLFAVAYARGLFVHTMDNVMELIKNYGNTQQRVPLPMRQHGYRQPVLSRASDPTKPLVAKEYRILFQRMCILANIVGVYGPYSWRRGSLTTIMRQGGSRLAQEVARPTVGKLSIYYYNRQPVANIDILAMLCNTADGHSADDMAAAASPCNASRWLPSEDEPSLAKVVEETRLINRSNRLIINPEIILFLRDIQNMDGFATWSGGDNSPQTYLTWIDRCIGYGFPGAEQCQEYMSSVLHLPYNSGDSRLSTITWCEIMRYCSAAIQSRKINLVWPPQSCGVIYDSYVVLGPKLRHVINRMINLSSAGGAGPVATFPKDSGEEGEQGEEGEDGEDGDEEDAELEQYDPSGNAVTLVSAHQPPLTEKRRFDFIAGSDSMLANTGKVLVPLDEPQERPKLCRSNPSVEDDQLPPHGREYDLRQHPLSPHTSPNEEHPSGRIVRRSHVQSEDDDLPR